ncbi:hypothetical protein IKI14_04565 [bacterium]|nr:hypothetical protein [bacterium]
MDGILVVLEFIVQNTDDTSSLYHKYEKPDKLLSAHQSLFIGLPHSHFHIINHPLHTYHGERCLVTSSHLSRADMDA